MNHGCKMTPVVQKMRKRLASDERPAAVEGSVATMPRFSESAAKTQQGIPAIYEEGVSENLFSTGNDSTDETIADTTPASKPRIEDRKSCRVEVPPSRQACELKVGADVVSARLVNESRGGFAVLVDRLNGIKVGKKVELRTTTGRFRVRVVYIKKVARPKDAAPECDSSVSGGTEEVRRSFPVLNRRPR